MKPRLLDLFCGAGGCAKGYQRAGFYVVGVDNRPQPNYCGDDFLQADALEVLRLNALIWEDVNSISGWRVDAFAAIHASPPCQRWMDAQNLTQNAEEYPDLITPLRPLLRATGLPYVVENVPRAPLINPLLLCGSMFDPPLGVKRHRHFETNWALMPYLGPCRHHLWEPRYPARASKGLRKVVSVFGRDSNAPLVREVMGMPWATRDECAQAIPPAYTELIGRQLMQHLQAQAA